LHAKVIRHVERVLLTQVLRQTRGHQAQASDLLGLNRTTLRNKLRDLGLTLDKIVTEEQT
jgi:two-component system nitrogen regulation response regulator GlnG